MNNQAMAVQDRKPILSTMWIFVMLNMIFADVITFLDASFLEGLLRGYAEEVEITEELMLIAAIVTQIPIGMVLLSRILPYRMNRLANLIAPMLTIVYIIGGGSDMPHYIFIATMEVICLLFIIWYAWTWRE